MRRYSLWMSLVLATGGADGQGRIPRTAPAPAPTSAPNPRGTVPVNPLRVPIAAPRTSSPGTTKDGRFRRSGCPGDARIGTVAPLPPLPEATLPTNPATIVGGQSVSLQAALYGAITSNPDLVTLRNSNVASPEAVEVARRFPTTLNPTLWIDYPADHPDPPRHLRPGGTRAAQRPVNHFGQKYFSSRPPADRAGPPDDAPLRDRQGRARASSNGPWCRPSCSRWSRPTGSSRPPPTAASGSGWPKELADFNDQLVQTLRRPARSQPGRARRRRAGRGRERGDPPAGRGRAAGLRRSP